MMVLPRLLTALVGAPLFLWALYLGSLPFLIMVFFLVLVALWEFHQMAETGGYATQSWWGVLVGMTLVLPMVFPGIRVADPFKNQAPAMMIFLSMLAIVLREVFRRDKSVSMLRMSMSFLGIFYIMWPLAHLILLRELRGTAGSGLFNVGRNVSFFLVFLIWVQDITAWAVGSTLGKHRVAPGISPKKSWEGAVAGLVGAVVVSFLMREAWLSAIFSRTEAVCLGAVLGILAQFSDLAESLLKRCFGVKDSSDLLPGHGGILDRFDSFIFAAPCLYFYLILFGKGY